MNPRLLFVLLAAVALLTVLAPAASAQVQNETHPAGTTISLLVTVDGAPTPTVEWFKDGKKVGEGNQLELGALTAAAAGSYTAKATNLVGSATSDPVVLAVTSAPSKPTIKVIAVKPSQVTVEVPKGTKVITK